ncbi:ribonucleases P/MRP protein subunit POP1 [Actinidia eriantha]|uniref:ribonucleases P/MRP protein subunit POP1 n=1 Tax=Actinidia eriantha TaxID=165200 RepID=UPI00258A0920|nr:ribonucleases P/MRP protein subunit POP1 [Actinidia eriantha]
MAMDGSKQLRVSATPPPRTLNLQKFAESRASEFQALHSIVANRLNNDFRSQRNKRRRTTGYDNRVGSRKRKNLGSARGPTNADKVPRRIRRRFELRENLESGFSTSGDGTKRLRTHVWHAKRFAMTKLWGFHLPLGMQGSGRGSRALLKRFRDGVLIHDASYYGAVQLEGPQNSLLQMLSTVLVSSQSSQSEDISHSVLSGAIYANAMLHHVGAPFSSAVAPVTYMWQPFHHQNIGVDADIDGSSSLRQLWVWIPAAAFSEGYDVLKLACQKQIDETGVSMNCISLHGKLAKLEVMGSKAFQLLQKILHPVTCVAENSWKLNKCLGTEPDIQTRAEKFSILENEDHISSSAIISLTVSDPRALSEEKVELVPEGTSTGNLGYMKEDEYRDFSPSADISGKNTVPVSSTVLEIEEDSALSDSMDLWDSSKGILRPVEENVICMEKHCQKLTFFGLGNTNLRKQNASTGGVFRRLCPILLLNNSNRNGSIVRWSIILPLSWVKAFWVPLVYGGARVIGLREKHWIACEVGVPCFPSDFPDCNAYACFMAAKAAAAHEEVLRRPPAMRPDRVPIPPPWESVRFSFEKELIRLKNTEHHSEESRATTVNDNSLINFDCGKSNTIDVQQCDFSFEGFVARTSNMLTHFLSEMRGDQLLLFPHVPDMKNNIAKFMKDDSRLSQGPNGATGLINDGGRLCYLRVLLHAYKGGVFEEGAVVCAPHYVDITLWTSRSDTNKEELQIPQTSVRSYFEQQPSGKWELQIPTDPVAIASHRWPIGFVSTGFVRGSKKPLAVALCDAILLARLREEQWNEVPVKRRRKEIYVLVRNLRSTAYRIALATIVLEQQEEDLVFM